MITELWITLVLATSALLIIPGPVVVLLLSQTLTNGRTIAAGAISGVVLGDLVAMTISFAGAGAILATSATLFTLLKIAGALYLVWLGISLWRSGFDKIDLKQARVERGSVGTATRWRAFRQTFIVTALNPKDIAFFVAFLPQFVDPARPAGLQVAIIIVTFLTLVVITTSLWVFSANRLRASLSKPFMQRLVSRTGAGALIGAGGLTALSG
ncbi:MAG: LysE family translocator [Pseudomonadota bacterium]